MEEVKTPYSLLKRKQTVYRTTHRGSRIYYTLNEDKVNFFISLTTLIRATVPKGEPLIKWIAEMGYDNAKKYMDERASYGTLLHYLIGVYVIQKSYDFDQTEQLCKEFGGQYQEDWAEELNNDLAAFMQFVVEYHVEPLAIELVLVSNEGFGTAVDLVCNMVIEEEGFFGEVYATGGKNNPKGSPKKSKRPKKITALINFKSGRKGFYEDNEIQLEFEKRLFEENYPEIKIDRIYNWSPKEWRDAPTFNLKDQTDSLNREKADALLKIGQIELMKRLPNIRTISGRVEYGQSPEISSVTLEQHILGKRETLVPAEE